MPTGYGNDNDEDGNDEDVDSTEFTTTWKDLFSFIFLNWRPRAEGRVKPIPKNITLFLLLKAHSNKPYQYRFASWTTLQSSNFC